MSIVVEECRDQILPKKLTSWSCQAPSAEVITAHDEWVKKFNAMCAEHDAENAARKSKTTPIILNES